MMQKKGHSYTMMKQKRIGKIFRLHLQKAHPVRLKFSMAWMKTRCMEILKVGV